MASSSRGPVAALPANPDEGPRPRAHEHHFNAHHHGTHDRQSTSSDDSSASGSSYAASDNGEAVIRPIASCRWRTPRFYNQECGRFFDCPSHQVERQLSDSEDESDEDDDELEITTHHADTVSRPEGRVEMESARENGGGADGEEEELRAPVPVPGSTSYENGNPSTSAQSIHGRRIAPQSGGLPTPGPSSNEPPAPLPALILQSTPQSRATATRPLIQPQPPPQTHIDRRLPDITLPRWQLDAEVTYCPICHTQFSIFVRKHHCRKCGRVVCNSCSPHRITIPYQYIVRNPTVTSPRQPTSLSTDSGSQDFGGERVRLCNPCVPDPNTTPPQLHASPSQLSPRGHGRSHSTLINAFLNGPPTGSHGGPVSGSSGNDAYPRTRSSTIHSALHSAPSSSRQPQPPQGYTEQRAVSGGMAIHHQTTAPPHSQRIAGADLYRNIFGLGSPLTPSTHRASSSRASPSSHRALPPEPPPLAEEDECPVCHRELPSMKLPNSETLREQHITSCIAAHSAYSGGPVQGSPDGHSTVVTRRTGIFPYIATEKDCVDSAECTICLEEFEVGVSMARLECLCRFHKRCIMAWFVGHPGRCPVHQHDGFGF